MPGTLTGLPDFECTATVRGGKVVVAVAGELDLATVGEPRALALEHLARRPVVLDLRRVTFMDSSAVKLIDDLMRAPGTLTFRVPDSESAKQALRLTELLDHLPLEDA